MSVGKWCKGSRVRISPSRPMNQWVSSHKQAAHFTFLGAGNRIPGTWRMVGRCGKCSRWMRKNVALLCSCLALPMAGWNVPGATTAPSSFAARARRFLARAVATCFARFGSRPRIALKRALGRLCLEELWLRFEGRRCDGELTFGRGRYRITSGHKRVLMTGGFPESRPALPT